MTISGVTLNAEFPDHTTDECSNADHLGVVFVAMVVMIWIIGAGQDASNSRSGVEPAEMTPLPTTMA